MAVEAGKKAEQEAESLLRSVFLGCSIRKLEKQVDASGVVVSIPMISTWKHENTMCAQHCGYDFLMT